MLPSEDRRNPTLGRLRTLADAPPMLSLAGATPTGPGSGGQEAGEGEAPEPDRLAAPAPAFPFLAGPGRGASLLLLGAGSVPLEPPGRSAGRDGLGAVRPATGRSDSSPRLPPAAAKGLGREGPPPPAAAALTTSDQTPEAGPRPPPPAAAAITAPLGALL